MKKKLFQSFLRRNFRFQGVSIAYYNRLDILEANKIKILIKTLLNNLL